MTADCATGGKGKGFGRQVAEGVGMCDVEVAMEGATEAGGMSVFSVSGCDIGLMMHRQRWSQ